MRYELYFDDFKVGDTFTTYSMTVTEEAIIDFAMRWDPYDYHVSVEAARKHPFGLDTVFASGFHTLCLSFRLFSQSGVLRDCGISGGGIEGLRWFEPVVPGDTLHAEVEVIATKASESNNQRGVVTMRHDTVNQHGKTVLTLECAHIVARRSQAKSGAAE